MLEVVDSNVLVDEYKVSHILLVENPMEGSRSDKRKVLSDQEKRTQWRGILKIC